MKACLLGAGTVPFAAIDGAMAQEDSNKKEEVRVPPTQKGDPRKQTEPTGAEKSVRPGGELSTRQRTRDDVIRDTLRDRRPK